MRKVRTRSRPWPVTLDTWKIGHNLDGTRKSPATMRIQCVTIVGLPLLRKHLRKLDCGLHRLDKYRVLATTGTLQDLHHLLDGLRKHVRRSHVNLEIE